MTILSARLPIGTERRAIPHQLIFTIAVLLAIAPVLLAGPVPAFLDYPNHVARMSILMRAGTAEANPFFEVIWSLMPNLAMDLIVPPIGRIIGIERACLLFLVASQLLVVAGAVAVELAVKGRFAFAGYAALLFLYGVPFAWGFVNFQFGVGIGLLGFAGWIRLSRNGWAGTALLHVGACLALFASHLFALGIYGWSVGLYELWRWRRDGVPLARRAMLVAILAAPPAILLVLMSLSGTSIGGERWTWVLASKTIGLAAASGVSLVLAVSIALTSIILLFYLWCEKGVRLIGAGRYVVSGFVVLYFLMPSRIFDNAFIDVRVALAAFLVVPAFMDVRVTGPWQRGVVHLVFAAMIVGSLATTAWHQAFHRQTYTSLLAAFDRLPKNPKLLLAYADDSHDLPSDWWDYPLAHVGTLAVLRANAFVPSLFMHPGKQPIRPASGVRHISLMEGGPVEISILRSLIDDTAARQDRYQYVNRWTSEFEFLCVLDPRGSGGQNPMPDLLVPVAQGDRFVLYRIAKN